MSPLGASSDNPDQLTDVSQVPLLLPTDQTFQISHTLDIIHSCPVSCLSDLSGVLLLPSIPTPLPSLRFFLLNHCISLLGENEDGAVSRAQILKGHKHQSKSFGFFFFFFESDGELSKGFKQGRDRVSA